MITLRRIRLTVILIALSGMGLCVTAHLLTPAALPPTSQAEIGIVTGKVEVWEPVTANWVPARVGQVMTEGARVRTGVEAQAALYLDDGSIIRLAPNTVFTLNTYDTDIEDTPSGVAAVRG